MDSKEGLSLINFRSRMSVNILLDINSALNYTLEMCKLVLKGSSYRFYVERRDGVLNYQRS